MSVTKSTEVHGHSVAAPSDEMEDRLVFRKALGQFATGVVLATCRARNGEAIGITANSFSSVSLQPRLILFSIDRRAFSMNAFLEADGFAINVLSEAQRHLSDRFAKSGGEKWQNVSYSEGLFGAPVFRDSLTVFECTPYAQYDGGDHIILVGEVQHVGAQRNTPPLLFYGGCYQKLEQAAQQGVDMTLSIFF